MKDDTIKGIFVILLIIGIIFFIVVETEKGKGETGTKIKVKFYDKDKNLISIVVPPTFAIVQNIPNVFFATFSVLAENTGDQSLNLWISGARQCNTADTNCMGLITSDNFLISGALWDAFDFACAGIDCKKFATVGDTVSFGESDFIDLDSFEGTQQRYAVQVTGSYEMPGTPYIEVKKNAWIDLTIKPDPAGAGFVVDIDSSAAGGIGLCAGIACDDYCSGTTSYYSGYCSVGTGTCKYSVKANAPACGGVDPCAGIDCSSYCVGTTLWYAGYCDPDITGSQKCVYQNEPNNAYCGGTGTP